MSDEGRALVVLIGAPGAGKTRTAKRIARLLNAPLVDTDKRIVAEHGPIATIFAATQSSSDRAIPADELAELVRDAGAEVSESDSFAEAIDEARAWAAKMPKRAVLVTGSITLVGEAIALAAEEGWKQ